MRLTVSNASISNTLEVEVVSLTNNTELINPTTLEVSNTAITVVNASAAVVGSNVIVNSTSVYTPQIIVGTGVLTGGLFSSVIDYQVFTSNGTWYNPYANSSVNTALSGDEQVVIMMWSAGGTAVYTYGGGNYANNSCGGGGGGCFVDNIEISRLANTCNVFINPPTLTVAGNSVFVVGPQANLVVVGANSGYFGAPFGGSVLTSNNTSGATTDALGGINNNAMYGWSSSGLGALTGNSIFGGGTGSWSNTTMVSTYPAGSSIYGGGGGGSQAANATGGFSVFGGFGGNSTSLTGQIPGGGGGANSTANGAGGRGEVRVWVLGSAKTFY